MYYQIGLAYQSSERYKKALKYFKKDNYNLELIPANKDFSTIKLDLREQEAFVECKSVGLIRTH